MDHIAIDAKLQPAFKAGHLRSPLWLFSSSCGEECRQKAFFRELGQPHKRRGESGIHLQHPIATAIVCRCENHIDPDPAGCLPIARLPTESRPTEGGYCPTGQLLGAGDEVWR